MVTMWWACRHAAGHFRETYPPPGWLRWPSYAPTARQSRLFRGGPLGKPRRHFRNCWRCAVIEFHSCDGFPPKGISTRRCYGPPPVWSSPRAMGVEQRFYADFAQWMAGSGLVGAVLRPPRHGRPRPDSLKRSLKGLDADIVTWRSAGCCGRARRTDRRSVFERPIHWLEPQPGRQIRGLIPNRERVARASHRWRWQWLLARQRRQLRRRVRGGSGLSVVPVTLPIFSYSRPKSPAQVGDLPHRRDERMAPLVPGPRLGVMGDDARCVRRCTRRPRRRCCR